MNVRVTYFGQVRAAAGVSTEIVAASDGETVAEFLQRLPNESRPKLSTFLFNGDHHIAKTLLVMKNDHPIPHGNLATTTLQPNDELTLVPPIAGG